MTAAPGLILASTSRHHQRIAVIYGSALLVIGIFAWLVSRPYLVLYSFRGEMALVTQQVQTTENSLRTLTAPEKRTG